MAYPLKGNTGSAYHKTKQQLEQEAVQIQAAQKDPEHFQPLYEEYYKQIFKFIYNRVADEQITADLSSQVFLKALINIKKYQLRTVPFSSWLYRIAMNEVNMHFRKNKNARTISFDIAHLKNIVTETEVPDEREAEQVMLNAIAMLPDEAVQLIELRFFEQRPFAEIADIYGTAEANVKMKLYRILEKLKKIIQSKLK